MFPTLLFRHARKIAALTTLIAVLIVVLVWQAIRQDQVAKLDSETRSNLAHFAARLETYVATRLAIGQQIRREWRNGRIPDRAEFAHRVAMAKELFHDIQAINWGDPDGVLRWVEPFAGNEAALGLNIRKLPVPSTILRQAERTGTMQLTPPIGLAQGGKGFVAYLPIDDAGAAMGFLNIVFRVNPLIRSALGEDFVSAFNLSIADGDAEVFSSVPGGGVEPNRVEKSITVGNRSWTITATPAQAMRASHESIVDELVLVAGLLLSVASAFLVWQSLKHYGHLRDSEQNLREVLEKSPIGVAIVVHEPVAGHVLASRIFANQALVKMLRANSVQELLESDIASTWIDADQLFAVNESMKAGIALVDFEVKRKRMDGTEWWVSMNTRPVRFDNRDCTMVWHFDITERKVAEQKFAEATVRFRELVDASPSRITLKDRDGKFLMVNKAFADDWDTTVDETTGKTMYEFTSREDADRSRDFDLSILSTGDPVEEEREVPLPGGRSTYVKRIKFPVRDPSGEITGIGTFISDITELKTREAELNEKTILLHTVLDTIPGAVTVRDRENRYTYLNKQAALYFEKPIDELIGKTAQEVLGDNYEPSFDKILQSVWEAGTLVSDPNYKPKFPHMVESTFWSIGSPIIDDTGEAAGIVMIYLDVTQQRQVEEQLRQAQKMEVVGQLTGGVAHDFNNMLGVIIGNLDFLAEELSGNPDLLNLVDTATAAALGGANLNRQLLAFSRQQALSPQVVNLNDCVSNILSMLPRTLGETVDIRSNQSRDLWLAHVDSTQVESALLNLAINARDAMPSGGRLTIKTANVHIGPEEAAQMADIAPGDYVMLSLSDTGTGMPPEILEHVFEPFYTTKDVGKGTGLGLSMVFGFAKQSGGHVAIASEMGRGTSVRLYLPRAKQADADADELALHKHLPEGERVLLVEDDPELRTLLSSMLSDLGYAVEEAGDGKTALDTLSRNGSPFNLLLTDIVLPGGVTGPDIAAEASRHYPDVKVLFMSGYPRSTVSQHNRFGEDVLIMEKPFRKAEFAQKVRQALNAG